MNLGKIKPALDYLVQHEWLQRYTLNSERELWLTYGLSTVRSTENYTNYFAHGGTSLAKMFEKLADEVGDDIRNSADSCGDFFGYDTEEEMEERIKEESDYLRRLSEIVKEVE